MVLVAGSIRGYSALGWADRVELGLTARLGLLAIANMRHSWDGSDGRGVCCAEVALAPDLRVWLTGNAALQLSPELAIGTTGNHNGDNTYDPKDEIFGQAAVWVGYVQAL